MTYNRRPHVILLRTAAVLLILVLLSTSMVAGRFARYTTTASGTDSARVAKFLVTESGSLTGDVAVSLSPGETAGLEVQVTNDSDVAVSYSVAAENKYNNLPLSFTLAEDKAAVAAATLAPGQTKTLTWQVSWDAEQTDDKYLGMVDLVHLTIHVTQID